MTERSDSPLPKSPRALREISPLLAAGILVLAGMAAYSNSFSGALVFDDREAIVENPAVRHLWPPWPLLRFGSRPLVMLSFAADYAIGGLRVAPYHAINLAIHILAALTLFGLIRRTLTLPVLRGRFAGASAGLALATALIWEVHPLQTESVTYIVQRAESLAGLFYLLTIYCVLRGASSDHSMRWHAAAVAACALGAGCKETVVTAPVAAFLYDRAFLSGSFREAFRRRWGLHAALAATWLLLIPSVWTAVGGQDTSAGFRSVAFTPLSYAVTQFGVILHYLRLSLWPYPLCLDYFWPAARTPADILPGAIVVGGLLAATIAALACRPTWGFLGAWFFLILAPTSSFMPLADAAVEHRMYLPLAAVVAAVVIGGCVLLRRLMPASRTADWIGVALVVVIAVALAGLTFRRNADYRSELSIWQDTVEKRPENPRAYNSLGLVYSSSDPGRDHVTAIEQAIRHFDRAIELAPDYAAAWNNRAVACDALGLYEEALRDSGRALELKPDFAAAYNTRGVVHARRREYAEAIRNFDRSLELKPDYAFAFCNRGNAYSAMGESGQAIADYTRAIELMPDYAVAWCNRGNARAGRQEYDIAIRNYSRAIELQPDYRDAYNNRAAAFYLRKEYRKAWADVQTLRKLGGEPQPEFLQALTRAMPPPE